MKLFGIEGGANPERLRFSVGGNAVRPAHARVIAAMSLLRPTEWNASQNGFAPVTTVYGMFIPTRQVRMIPRNRYATSKRETTRGTVYT